MNILVINGSPKGAKSNTYRLTCAFLEGISAGEEKRGKQAPETEFLEISRLNIKPCRGCFSFILFWPARTTEKSNRSTAPHGTAFYEYRSRERRASFPL